MTYRDLSASEGVAARFMLLPLHSRKRCRTLREVKLLVVGSGGREHALAWKLAQSPAVTRIFCAPGNGGTLDVAENVPIAANQLPELARFAKENCIDLTVVGPDGALAEGIVDLFKSENLRIFGPSRAAAQVEASKVFAKNLMFAAQVPTARAETFVSAAEAMRYAEEVALPVVVKADGLALGKGVIIANDRESARDTVRSMMEARIFGVAGKRVLLEECLRGSECSVHALVSGSEFRLLATARDHKRALEGDVGPNTGGMGAVSPADNWSDEYAQEFAETIMRPFLRELSAAGICFRGLLFPGLMVTAAGLHVLEFNCRFGDPETQAILPRLQSDLLPLMMATIDGDLTTPGLTWDPRIAVTVILASRGYPGRYETGKPIHGLEKIAKLPDVRVFHAGTKRVKGEVVSSGGRVLAVTALGHSIADARARVYAAVAEIEFEGCCYRRDIALPPGRG